MSEQGWTIRVGDRESLVSRDDGETARVETDIVRLLKQWMVDSTAVIDRAVTACAAASLAEARHVAPGPGSAPPPVDAPSDPRGGDVLLGPVVRELDRPFGDVLARRQSERRLGPLELDDLATVLYHGARLRGWHDSDDGYQMTSRPSPSAGGRHPYELMVAVGDVGAVPQGLWLFDPAQCSLAWRAIEAGRLRAALRAVNAAAGLDSDAPATLFVVAHFQRTLSRYPAGSTLVWRDLGAVAATLHLAASAAGLASCIVGTGGVLAFDESELVADGIALILGTREQPDSSR